MILSDEALRLARELIKQFEGLELTAYEDVVGVWTIGYGSTREVEPGDVVTLEGADALLEADMSEAVECVARSVGAPLSEYQAAALVAFVFNVGCGAFTKSTLLRLLNAGHYDQAALQFARWNKAGGKVVRGLTRRRAAEAELFRRTE